MKYKISETQYLEYCKLVDSGVSKRQACIKVGAKSTTMYDYIKRLESAKKSYLIAKRKNTLSIIVNDSIYNIDTTSNLFRENEKLFHSLIVRNPYDMTNDEFEIIKSSDYHEEVTNALVVTENQLKIKNGKCYYKGKVVPDTLYKTLSECQHKKKGDNIVKFTDLLLQNPDEYVIEQIYPFLVHNDIEIDENGFIIAYKKVNDNYKDFRTNSFDNSIGSVVKEDRDVMDTNPQNTCSKGLHVGSRSYISKMYPSGLLVACRVNPKDVVSVPVDYNGGKCRVCEYTVISDAS